jgi:hypothetical protein
MKPIVLLLPAMLIVTTPALGEVVQFGQKDAGALPAGWVCGITGHGSPKWNIEPDPSSPEHGNVLRQSGSGDFPWCVDRNVSLADGFVETRFKPVGGHEDQAGGVVWRWKNADNYYVARANALENNVSLYYTTGGHRRTIQYRPAPVPARTWHTLRVEFEADHIRVSLDGKRYIDVTDNHIAGPGAVGVWTKADSVTVFDTFSFDDASGKPR